MQTHKSTCKLWLVLSWLLLAAFIFSGCRYVQRLRRRGPSLEQILYDSYNQTQLRASSSSNVLATIHGPGSELLSQSESVIAAAGQNSKGRKSWFNLVAFDQNTLTAKRKYVFITDDRPNFMEQPRKSASFDCEMELDSDVLDEPYANENARRIAILRRIRENTNADIAEVGSDNKMIDICGMIANQSFEMVLVGLEASPAMAARLSESKGLDFSHITFSKGRIQMVLDYDIVKVKMRLGRDIKKWDAELKKAAKAKAQQATEPPQQ
jgi:hypothetical protein